MAKLVFLVVLLQVCAFGAATSAPPAKAAAPSSPGTVAVSPGTASEEAPVPVPEPSEKALRYYRGNMVLWGVRTAWGMLVPAVILFTGFSARLRNGARRVGRKWLFVIAVYACLLGVVMWLVDLPLDYYQGFVREHAYDLSNQTFGKWWGDSVKSLLVGLIFSAAFLWVPYLLLRKSPRRWWLITGVLVVPFLVLVMLIQPIWIDPLFNKFGPMKDPTLERDILALARRAGIEGGRVFEVDKHVDTEDINAYVSGVFQTKRIVLWDTIIAKLNRDQLVFVMGHEMGHYVLGHVRQGIVVVSLLVLITLYVIHRVAHRVIAWFKPRFGFDQLQDVASLPLLLVLSNLSVFPLLPLVNAYSRHQEHEADRFGLELMQNNHAAATSFVRMQQVGLGNPRPGIIYKLWQASHPTLADRIEFCNQYQPWRTGQPLKYADRFKPTR